jgi:hypothetical protein
MNVPHRAIQPDSIGVALVIVGSTLMSVGAVQTAGPHQNVWSNPWFDFGCVAFTPGVILVIYSIVLLWRSRRLRPVPATETGILAADHTHPASSPLLLRPGKEEWRLFNEAVWAFGIQVRVTNVTDEPRTLVRYHLLSERGATQRQMLSREVQESVDSWLAAFSSKHESDLFACEVIVPPGESITEWFVNSAPNPQPDGGRPALTLQLKDSLGDTYELNIPANPLGKYRF